MGSALGWSFGGVVAHELAVELQRRGCLIARLILFDAQPAVDDRADRAAPPDDALGERQVPEASRSKRLFDLLTENLRKKQTTTQASAGPRGTSARTGPRWSACPGVAA